MNHDNYVVPECLRSARFVLRQPGTRREPKRVSPGAFTAAGLTVPEDRRQWNVYQLTQRQGEPWSPEVDRHVGRFGAELLGGRDYLCIDCDRHLAVDGEPWLDGFRWLADAALAAGQILDLGAFLAVRTPGDADRGHGPGWHLWARPDPDYPVRFGALARCKAIEIKSRCTAPGSPGYSPRRVPDRLPVIPRWLAELAGPPRQHVSPQPSSGTCSPAIAWRRMCGMVDKLRETTQPGRNSMLFSAARLAGELGFEYAPIESALTEAAGEIGLVRDDGEAQVRATIRSGYAAGAGRVVTRA